MENTFSMQHKEYRYSAMILTGAMEVEYAIILVVSIFLTIFNIFSTRVCPP